MKKFLLATAVCLLAVALTACGCKHETWTAADCVTPKTCAECGEIEGEALGHKWIDATCETAKTCSACNMTEGSALGHSWVDATCAEAKHCQNCDLTEGKPLAHTWLDATTEAPFTCSACGLTEGERIITDARFTTANNQMLFGKWRAEFVESTPELGFDTVIYLYMEFFNDGTMKLSMELKDPDAFKEVMAKIIIDSTYAEMAAQGYDKAGADEAFMATYGMTLEAYCMELLNAMDMNELFGVMEAVSYVYYAEDGVLYTGLSWNIELDANEFTIEDDVLYLNDPTLSEEPTPFYKVQESNA